MQGHTHRRTHGLAARLTALIAALAVLTFLTAGQVPAADAATGSHMAGTRSPVRPHTTGCDVPDPQIPMVQFPPYADTPQEICGIYSVENNAYDLYAEIHGYAQGDPRIAETGEPAIAGMTEGMLEVIANMEANDPTALTTDDVGAYDWLYGVNQDFQQVAAQDALDEYNKWNSQQCNYKPPNTSLFTYNPMDQNYCLPQTGTSLAGLLTGLAPPSYQEFKNYGIYEADQQMNVTNALGGVKDQQVVEDQITAGAGAAATILGGAAAPITVQITGGSQALANFASAVKPNAKARITLAKKRLKVKEKVDRSAKTTQEQEKLKAQNEPNDEDLDTLGESEPDALPEGGIEVDQLAAEGADAFGGAFAIVTIAVTIAVMQGINVVTAALIPGQLQSDLDSANNANHATDVNNLIEDPSGAGYLISWSDFENQLSLPGISIGNPASTTCLNCQIDSTIPPAPPGQAAEIETTALTSNGTPTSWSWTAPTVPNIDTWPLGVDNGLRGPPEVSVGVANGMAWTEQQPGYAPTDETSDGLSGYLPSGEFRYFDAAGHPQTAYIDGNQFVSLTSNGSIDAAGQDQGDDCATAGECTKSNSIIVMGLGGTPELASNITGMTFFGMTCNANDPGTDDCLSDTLLPDGNLVPSGGHTVYTLDGNTKQTGTSQLFRLTIKPDTGTPPGMLELNQYGAPANDQLGGIPNGGFVAGQTVSLSDPSANPFGLSTTYKWQIETKCGYDASHSPADIQGVPVCPDNPDYSSINGLSADEQDLTACNVAPLFSCNPSISTDWTEDPAFHGDPVTTITGPGPNWTWPAPGVYHVRLTTTDADGAVNTSDEDVTVAATPPPGVQLSYALASGPQPSVDLAAVGPVPSGDALTVTGCLSSADNQGAGAYSTPNVSVAWGDGSNADVGTAGSNTDTNITFTYQPGGGCSSPWQFTATHTYNIGALSGIPFIQKAITVAVSDVTDPATPSGDIPPKTSTSSSRTLYADVYPTNSSPSFVSGPTTTVNTTAGSTLSYTGLVDSDPAASSITQSGASGVTENGVACTAAVPSGMGFVGYGNNTFVIDGATNVHADGCYAITVTATNANGTAHQQLILNENQAPTVTSAGNTAMATGATGSFTFTSTGFPAPHWALADAVCAPNCGNALPADLTFKDNGDGTATLGSGGANLAAADAGTYTFTLTASSSSGTVTQNFTLTIGGLPRITSSAVAGYFTQSSGGFTITTAGYPTATNISCTTLVGGTPSPCNYIDANFGAGYGGLDFSNNGDGTASLGGAPWGSGSFTVTITATNAVGSTQQTLVAYVSNTGGTTLDFVQAGSVVQYQGPSGMVPAAATADFEVGSAGTVTLCSNEPSDVLSVDGSLPSGLTLTNGAGSGCPGGDVSATISGTPTTPLLAGSKGTFAFRIADGANGLCSSP